MSIGRLRMYTHPPTGDRNEREMAKWEPLNGSAGKAPPTKPGDLSLIPRMETVEGESLFAQVVL